MCKYAFPKFIFTCLLLSLASCAMTEKFFPNSEYSSLMEKGDVAMRQGAWSKAAPLFEEAAYLKPDELDARLKQAQAYQNDGKLAQAYNVYQIIIYSKAPSNELNDNARKQAKIQQAKTGFKVEPSVTSPEAKPVSPALKPAVNAALKAETKIPAVIPSVNADVSPVPATEPKQLAKLEANKAVLDELAGWREAWVTKNLKAYYAHYVEGFAGDATSVDDWRQQRKAKISSGKSIKLILSDVQVKVISDELAELSFKQVFQTGSYKDVGRKSMQMQKLQDRWLISQESFK